MKQKIYESILERQIGMYYSAVIRFQTSLVNMDKAKPLTKKNKWGKRIINKEVGAYVAPPSAYELPQIISLWGFLIKGSKSRH